MPSYIKVDEQKNLFNDAKLGDVITFNPKKAYPENDTEVSSLLKIEREAVKDLESEFSFQITEIQRFKKHEINEELFKQVLGEDTDVRTRLLFRATELQRACRHSSLTILIINSSSTFARHCEKERRVNCSSQDALLKRIMLANNKDKGEELKRRTVC